MIKRLLTIILALIFAFSAVSSFAEQNAPADEITAGAPEVLQADEETEAGSDAAVLSDASVSSDAEIITNVAVGSKLPSALTSGSEYSLEPMADSGATGKFVSKLFPDYTLTEFTDDYSLLAEKPSGSTSKFKWALYEDSSKTTGFYVSCPYGSESQTAKFEQNYELAPFKNNSSNPYLKLSLPKDITNRTGPTYIYELNTEEVSQGEKLHYSMDLRNDDVLFNKAIIFSKNQKPYGGSYYQKLVNFETDGKISFYGCETEIPYLLGVWYHLDIVFDFVTVTKDSNEAITAAKGKIYYYINGNLVATVEDINLYSAFISTNYWQYIGYLVDTKVAADGVLTTVARPVDSALYADNFSAKILSSEESPFITKNPSPVYTNFEGCLAKEDNSVFAHSDGNAAYSLESGVYGKASTDKSLKAATSAGTEVDTFVAKTTGTLSALYNHNLSAGKQLKLSYAYAYSKIDDCTYANLSMNTETVNLIKVAGSDGSLYLAGDDTGVKLAAERWYNLDAIITVESDLDLAAQLYVNGTLVSAQTIAYSSTWSTAANTVNISKVLLGTSAASESYYDEIYICTFDGTAKANDALVESSDAIDTSDEIGKALVDVSLTLDEFLAGVSADSSIKVYRNGAATVAGNAADTLIVAGEETYTPTYLYVYSTMVLSRFELSADSDAVTASANIESMLSSPKTITLVVVSYVTGDDGFDRVHTVKTQTKNCHGKANAYEISVNVPAGVNAENYRVVAFTTSGWSENLPAFGNRLDKKLSELW